MQMSCHPRVIQNALDLRPQLAAIWQAGVSAVSPAKLVAAEIRDNEELRGRIAKARRVILLGAGKASREMVEGALDALPSGKETLGWIHVIDGLETDLGRGVSLIPVRQKSENFPTERGLVASRKMMELASSAGDGDLGLFLLSGGASAMMPLPAGEIGLRDKQAVTKLLHSSGATITEMNAVRKQLSSIKGGGLARAWSGDKTLNSIWTLAISDVVGDDPDVIGSGPTVFNPGTAKDALDCLKRYELLDQVPRSVIAHLSDKENDIPEYPKGYPWSKFVLVGDNRKAVRAAMDTAREMGWKTLDLGSRWEMETASMAEMVVGLVRNVVQNDVLAGQPLCILFGGETHLKLGNQPGLGGRNQHLALLVNKEMMRPWMAGANWLFGGTDGEDGPTESAGGFADMAAWHEMVAQKIDIGAASNSFSSHEALKKGRALLTTGPTGTNVADLWVGLVRSC